jgi:hypothetical protein
MQTFLPYLNFEQALNTLDYRRLGKQRVEGLQLWLLNNKLNPTGEFTSWLEGYAERREKPELLEPRTGWINHPVAVMWRGYEDLLAIYTNTSIKVWIDRGYNSTMETLPTNSVHEVMNAGLSFDSLGVKIPNWLTKQPFANSMVLSHRSNLLRKDPEWYGQFRWKAPRDLPYIYPEGMTA